MLFSPESPGPHTQEARHRDAENAPEEDAATPSRAGCFVAAQSLAGPRGPGPWQPVRAPEQLGINSRARQHLPLQLHTLLSWVSRRGKARRPTS